MHTHDDRGMATAEYTVGTMGAVLVGAVLYKLGMLDAHNPWMDSIREILENALGWGRLHELVKHVPRLM